MRNFDPHRYHRLFPQTNYIALDCSALPRQFIPGAPCTPTHNTGVADPALNSSLNSILLPKTSPGTAPMEFTPPREAATSPFLSLQGSFPTPHTMHPPREASLNDATTAAAASRISTTGPVLSKPEKRRRSVRFEDEVAEQAKSDRKTKTAHSPIQRPKIRHTKPSEMPIATLTDALGKRGWDEPNDSDNSSFILVLGASSAARRFPGRRPE